MKWGRGGRSQIDSPPPGKTTLKKPSLIRVKSALSNKSTVSFFKIYCGLLRLLVKLLLNCPSLYFLKLVPRNEFIFYHISRLEPANLPEMIFLREILKNFAKV